MASSVPAPYRKAFLARWQAASHAPQQFGSGQDRAIGVPHGLAPDSAERLAGLSHLVFAQAFLNAMRPALYMCAGACLIGAVVALVMQSRHLQPLPAMPKVAELEPVGS